MRRMDAECKRHARIRAEVRGGMARAALAVLCQPGAPALSVAEAAQVERYMVQDARAAASYAALVLGEVTQ